ncbi:lytic murein transglycosylase [Roseiarcaceae bacterium H3SJ34-1]|uniref:lytic murein transglycosylase n=1 Tax=Terripilifer ovatus TaxID=3032367 RepID=UPI003AB9A7AE|nr:lytic murein transglycosylase [Roseiarcaceae bacterium H3SJ34-1]
MPTMRGRPQFFETEPPLGRRISIANRGQIMRALILVAGCTALACGLGFNATARAAPAKRPAPVQAKSDAAFTSFIAALWPEAQARGVSRDLFDQVFQNMTPDASLLKQHTSQAEFIKPIWSYLSGAVTPARVATGQEMQRRYGQVLADAERRYGVDPYVVLAIWGMETSYGQFTGGKNVVRSLATLAYGSSRRDFFRNELLIALTILQQGHISYSAMNGSWAGAMGQTQFMPSSFTKHAVDYDGDGHKNIWTSIPDAIASTANYLADYGWQRGMTWGYEVILPAGFDVGAHEPQTSRSFSQWASLGIRRADGQGMPTGGEGSLFLPAGLRGPAFLITPNFKVIKSYNNSQAYALGVAVLSDRIAGAPSLAGKWPTGDKPLSTAQAMEIQRHLNRLGFDVGKIDGKIGEQVQTAIRAFQKRRGLTADGYATASLLEQVRAAR